MRTTQSRKQLGIGQPLARWATTPAFSDAQLFPKRKYKNRESAVVHEDKRGTNGASKSKGCPECGSPSRHKATCSKAGGGAKKPQTKMEGNEAWKDLGEVSAPRPKAMSRMTFGRVKISQEHDLPAETIARNIDEPLSEVEKAFDANTYDEYLAL